MPNVTIGHGPVVASGSVVTRSVAPLTMAQGNPAQPIARCGVRLGLDTPVKEFCRQLTPIERAPD
jgi:acetyltransferase-like isoleucine patch superfamily enzyme